MEKNYLYSLRKKLRYTPAGKGDFEETAMVEFKPPSMAVFDESTDFEQIIMRAMLSTAKSAGSDNPDEPESQTRKAPTPLEIRMVLHTGSIPIKNIAKLFQKLAYKTGYLDEMTPIKKSHFNKLSKEDFMDMMCGYASFFTFPSLLGGEELSKSGSGLSVI